MSEPKLDLSRAELPVQHGRPVGQMLLEAGALETGDLLNALAEKGRSGARIARICEADALADPSQIVAAQARHWGVMALDRDDQPPDPDLRDMLSAEFCLEHLVLPWLRIGKTLVIATARPDAFETLRTRLPDGIGSVQMAVTHEADIHAEIAARHGAALMHAAETRVRTDESCRDLALMTRPRAILAGLLGLGALSLLALMPGLFFACLASWAIVALILSGLLKGAAFVAQFRHRPVHRHDPPPFPWPTVSVMVPLYHEDDIAGTLVKRLSRLTYPRALLDVVLVLEAKDDRTRKALVPALLPPWMRVIEVPDGSVTTKPRALNYALGFCRGEIVGIYDAEDAPAPDQLDRVVAHFNRAPAKTACLQGILDFYNPRANWLSRCFSIEYASWFRILLPGFARLGFAIPLGGTTVFFRRKALEHVGGWDAHNVTEDADLGFRLARYGYQTELLASVTREEANNRFWPWVKQRSRWLKGYMITYLTHMRSPRKLWRTLGPWKFTGFQVFFLTTISQFLLAPIMWSFWLVLFGMPHPMSALLDNAGLRVLTGIFLASEALAIVIGLAAVARTRHRGLWMWVPTLLIYYMMGWLAATKAAYELLVRPFYWDKTAHGHSPPDAGQDTPSRPAQQTGAAR
ncbi:glycosyltransferase family 2 protein [Primorskyibacter flagellatus]|uniref:Glycosyltransferase, catalytic subunit of cellulose synthase and poly-beta-1,6-N-acetylglucosamine synthase n=1 Tax=Primorskyibacter flagellatus TaxID=1387277 RepID=A0A1W2BGV9_9RHOB|nr:glycosyltransferase family 2 protein [Primorskyibacter flagellatus]SMC71942.1 Glycosyltransferase, catalytic subunit of cellulose synthase and poly-beta-1,6-N-acetylglucosamine synthase [Primorskyibacter flagellatus]